MSYESHIGRTETATDIVDLRHVTALAATLDHTGPDLGPGDPLPPLWHWILFQQWLPQALLGPDGHPKRGGFLPPVHHLPRRMWAGSTIAFAAPLRIGDAVSRTSRILSILQKSGRSGALVFVTVLHEITGPAGLAISETQEIVYRDGTAITPNATLATLPANGVQRTVDCNALFLFRYSALTGNSHRIHYDQDYVRQEEGYPGLLVHLPLQATLLAALATSMRPGRAFASLSFRGLRPAFAGQRLCLQGWRDGDTFLQSRDEAGSVCVRAEARFH